MTLDHITWASPIATVTFSRADIELLLRCSAVHYDGHCRDVGKPGCGSFLHRWQLILNEPSDCGAADAVTFADVTFRELDTCAKLLEMPVDVKDTDGDARGRLHWTIHKTLGAINDFVREARQGHT